MKETESTHSGPELARSSCVFVQDGNTIGTTAEFEQIEIRQETQIPGEQPFYVLKSETGWSFDSVDELVALLRQCEVRP